MYLQLLQSGRKIGTYKKTRSSAIAKILCNALCQLISCCTVVWKDHIQ